MTAKGHTLLGKNFLIFFIPAYTTILDNYNFLELLILYMIFIFGVLFVDIDEPKSYIGRKLFFLSYPFKIINFSILMILSLFTKNKSIKRVFEHRGITHMMLFPLFFFTLSELFTGFFSICLKSLALGVFLHQLGDLLTNTGIRNYLFPLPITNVKFPFTFETNSIVEKIIIFLLMMLFLFQLTIFFNGGQYEFY